MNQQAQVGRTMTTLNLGYALALMNKKVMLIDMDPTAQLTQDCDLGEVKLGINQVLQNEKTMEQVRHELADGFDVIPVGSALMDYEKATRNNNKLQQSYKLKQTIDSMIEQQDFILIDCPSKPSLLTVNALLAADEVIIPTNISYLSLQGLVRIVILFKRLKKLSGGAKLWLVLTQMNQAEKITSEVKNMLMAYFPQRVLNTVIRQDESLSESRVQKKAIFDYHQESHGAADYFSMAQDIIEGRVS
jgi:chromosome partitioning protein